MEAESMEERRKRLFALLCISVSIPVIISFTIVNFIEGDAINVMIDILICVVFLGGLITIRKRDVHLNAYRLTLALLSLSFFYKILIGAGDGTVMYWLFPFPLVFVFFLGKKEGGLFAAVFFCISSVLLINPFAFRIYEYSMAVSLRFLASLLLVTLIGYGLEASREKFEKLLIEQHAKLREEKQNLQQALGEIKTLNGLIPICSNCKKIRNDEGYWQQVDVYVRDHTHADFSHGICPDCIKKLYPDYKGPEAK